MITYKDLKELLQLSEGVNDPGIFKIVFTAGGPGSGKSFIAGKTGLTSMGLRAVNSDDIFEKKLEAAFERSMNDIGPKDIMSPKGQEIRGAAKKLTGKKQDILIDGRIGLLIDGTGKDVNKIKKQKAGFERLGYECMMIFVNTTLDTSISRDKMRSRTVGADAVTDMWSEVQNNIGAFQRMFGNDKFIIVDNTEGKDFKKETMTAYKTAIKFIGKPPKTRAAKRWIQNEMSRRNITKRK
jgi:hypothetical protein